MGDEAKTPSRLEQAELKIGQLNEKILGLEMKLESELKTIKQELGI